MNAFDNEVVLEWIEGLLVFRDYVTNEDHLHILFSEFDPNTSPPGGLSAPTGSTAFGPSGSWENISPLPGGTTWQLIGTGIVGGDGFLAPNEFWVDPTGTPGPTGREVHLIQEAIDLADILFAPGVAIVIRCREGQTHTWAAGSTALPTRDITVTAIGQIVGEEINAAAAGRIDIVGAGAQLFDNPGVQRNFEIRNLAVHGALLVHQGWNLTVREAVVDGLHLTLDQGGALAVNPIRILLEDTSGDSDRYAGGESVITVATTNHNAPTVLPTILRASRCELQGVSNDVSGERFFHLGNTGTLFDGCTFNLKSESDTDGLWIGLASPCNLEFTASSFVGDFLGTTFLRPLFSASGATPFVRFTSLTVDAADTLTGLPTPTWRWGTLTPQGYPAVRFAKAPIAAIPGATTTDASITTALSGLGPITESVMSDLGVTVTGGRLVYGVADVVHSAPGATLTPIFFAMQSAAAAGPQIAFPLLPSRTYVFDFTAVMRNAPIPPLVGWTVATLQVVLTVDGAGTATIVSTTPGAVAGGDAMFSLFPAIIPGPPDFLDISILAADPGVGQTAAVDVEAHILAV